MEGLSCNSSMTTDATDATRTTDFFTALSTIYEQFINNTTKENDEDEKDEEKDDEKEEAEEISITVCEVMGDSYRDVLQTHDTDEHILQHEPATTTSSSSSSSTSSIPQVWLTNMISVRVHSSNDFQRVLNIVHARRSRLSHGTTEHLNNGSTLNDTRTQRIASLPLHPASQIIITVEATSTSSSTTRTLTAISLGCGTPVEQQPTTPTTPTTTTTTMTSTTPQLRDTLAVCEQSLLAMHRILMSIASNAKYVYFECFSLLNNRTFNC